MKPDEALPLRNLKMVGPLSTEEIEDVVSSVRRLVSNEQRPRSLSRDLNADRLVLTSAQRVVTEGSVLSPLILATPVLDQPPPAASEPVADGDARPVSIWAESEADAVLVEADWEDDIWAEASPSLAEAALGAEEAEVMATEPVPEPVIDPKVDEADRSSADPVPFVPLRRRAESLAARHKGKAPASETPVGEVPVSPISDESHLGVAEQADPEPDDLAFARLDEVGSDISVEADRADGLSEGRDGPHDPSVAPNAAAELVDQDGEPFAVLDEAALQDIVRQLIHEELQGELGERITRSVRKLVRAEINRALIARDLD